MQISSKIIGAISVFAALGCAQPEYFYSLIVKPEGDYQVAYEAAHKWEMATEPGGVWFEPITLGYEGCKTQYCIYYNEVPLHDAAFDRTECDTEAVGCDLIQPDTQTSHVVVVDDFSHERKLGIAIHELGHALGLQHNDGKDAMNPDFFTENVEWGDVEQFYAIRNWRHSTASQL